MKYGSKDNQMLPILKKNFGDSVDFSKDSKKLQSAIKFMYSSDNVEVLDLEDVYYGRVFRSNVKVDGEKKTVYVKEDWETSGIEAYTLAIYNAISSDPIHFAAFDETIVTEKVPGRHFKTKECSIKNRKIARSYGENLAIWDFMETGDRNDQNQLVYKNKIRSIDIAGSLGLGKIDSWHDNPRMDKSEFIEDVMEGYREMKSLIRSRVKRRRWYIQNVIDSIPQTKDGKTAKNFLTQMLEENS